MVNENIWKNASGGGVGHPNCKHSWTLFVLGYDQIQEEIS